MDFDQVFHIATVPSFAFLPPEDFSATKDVWQKMIKFRSTNQQLIKVYFLEKGCAIVILMLPANIFKADNWHIDDAKVCNVTSVVDSLVWKNAELLMVLYWVTKKQANKKIKVQNYKTNNKKQVG